jgi:hypothetical protein
MVESQYFPIHTEGMKQTAMKVLEKMPLPCEITIQPFKTARSQAQNRTYWLWLSQIAQQMEVEGEKFTKEEWHDLCRMKWIGVKVIKLGGKEFPRPLKSTTKLKVGEFAEYLTKIESHFLAKGVALTFTDDYGKALGHEQ